MTKVVTTLLQGFIKVTLTVLTPFMPAVNAFRRIFEYAVKLELKTDAGRINLAFGAFVAFLAILHVLSQTLHGVWSLIYGQLPAASTLRDVILWPAVYFAVCTGVVALVESKSNAR